MFSLQNLHLYDAAATSWYRADVCSCFGLFRVEKTDVPAAAHVGCAVCVLCGISAQRWRKWCLLRTSFTEENRLFMNLFGTDVQDLEQLFSICLDVMKQPRRNREPCQLPSSLAASQSLVVKGSQVETTLLPNLHSGWHQSKSHTRLLPPLSPLKQNLLSDVRDSEWWSRSAFRFYHCSSY